MSTQPSPTNTTSNIWGLWVEERDGDWCVCSMTDGRVQVVSRHGGREQAEAAVTALNTTGDRGASLHHDHRGGEPGEAIDARREDRIRGEEHESDGPPTRDVFPGDPEA